MTRKYSIVLTFYNEAENLSPLFFALEQVLPIQTEVVIVDDASTDDSWRITSELSSDKLILKRIRNLSRLGLASSILTGIRGATGTHVILMDSDFTHNPKDIDRLIAKTSQFDLAIASRYVSGGSMKPWYLYFSSRLYVNLLRIYLRLNVRDLLGGYFVFRREAFKQMIKNEFFEGFGDYSIAFCLFAEINKLNLIEIPVVFQERKAGKKKSKRLRMMIQYLKSSRKFKRLLSSQNQV